ncbi:hypothetical protein [Streptomyces sp. NPDC007984]|uniref:hypothetical protein n=1 Tax=Streptomyces sp. NPDC007984 TaxID=3364801 RepID=UPI0036E4AC14
MSAARRDEDVARGLRRAGHRRMDCLRELYGAFRPDEGEVEGPLPHTGPRGGPGTVAELSGFA